METKTIITQCGKASLVFDWFAELVRKSPTLTLGEMAEMQAKLGAK